VSIWDYFVWFFWFYIAISCLWIFITVIIDVFRDPANSGWVKALWTLFLVVFPFLAAFIYLIARGRGMASRNASASRTKMAENDDYIRKVSASPAADIESAKRLLDSGTITQGEFDALKDKAMRSA
jgi:hypothetical protein